MLFVPPQFVSAVAGRLPEPVRRWACSPAGRRMVRFAPAAVLALAASQITYLTCDVLHTTGRVSGAAGWFAGAAVSYGATRWAWERRGRPRVLRETLPFVAVSLAAGAVLVEAGHLGHQEAGALGLHGIAFLAFAQGFYLAANGITFVMRFFIFSFVVFADRAISLVSLYARFGDLIRESARFTVVGLAGLIVTVGGANLLRYRAGMGSLTAAAVALVVATAITFVGSRYWTFRHRERTGMGRESALFFAVNGIGIVISEGCIGLTFLLGLDGGLSYNIALDGGIALATLFRYWSYKKWVWPAGAVMPARGTGRPARFARVLYARFRQVLPEMARFSVVGAFAFLVSGAVAPLLRADAGAGRLTADVVAVVLAVAVSYAGNRYWTFRDRQRTTVGRESVRYFLLYSAGLAIQVACLRLATGLPGLHGRLPVNSALAIGIGLGFAFRYWSCTTWVWQAQRPVPPVVA
jgi:putative flippase GtrA